MNNVITVENTEMQVREYNGQRVVTFKDIDAVHQRKPGTARNNFYKNKSHFINGEDYYNVAKEDSNVVKSHIGEISSKGLTLITETGYLMLVKSFRDDLAWKVQRQLVKSYFQKPLLNLAEKYKRPVSSCPAPLATDFYNTNWEKISCCKRANSLPESDILDVVFAYVSRKYDFDISTDYLLGYSNNKYADENYQMITRITGLTDESIDCLKTLKFDDDKLKLLNLLIGNYELFSELLQNLDVVFFQKKTMELNIYDPSFASIYAYTRIANILNKYGEVIDSENV